MADAERIRIEARLAIMERKFGKDLKLREKFKKSDFFSCARLKGFFCYTAGYGISAILFMMLVRDMDITDVSMDIGSLIMAAVLIYVTGVVIYVIFSWIVAGKRFKRIKRESGQYTKLLEELYQRL